MAIFGSKPHEQQGEEAISSNSQTLIGKGAFLMGDMQIYGPLRLDGEISGSITSKSRVVLGDSAKLKGNLLAQSAEISGEIEGKVEIVETLTLKPTANIKGDIACNKLVIEPGATFNGSCDMSQPTKEIRMDKFQAASPKNNPQNTSHEGKTASQNAS